MLTFVNEIRRYRKDRCYYFDYDCDDGGDDGGDDGDDDDDDGGDDGGGDDDDDDDDGDGDGDADLVDVLLAPCLYLREGHHVEDEPVHRRGRRLGAGDEEVQHHTTHVGSCMQIATEQFRNTCVQQQERTMVLLKRRCSTSRVSFSHCLLLNSSFLVSF